MTDDFAKPYLGFSTSYLHQINTRFNAISIAFKLDVCNVCNFTVYKKRFFFLSKAANSTILKLISMQIIYTGISQPEKYTYIFQNYSKIIAAIFSTF